MAPVAGHLHMMMEIGRRCRSDRKTSLERARALAGLSGETEAIAAE